MKNLNYYIFSLLLLISAIAFQNSYAKPLEIVAGRDMTCTRHDSGAVDCWGPWKVLEKYQAYNCLYDECTRPIRIMDGKTPDSHALHLSAYEDRLCVVTQSKQLRCETPDGPTVVENRETPTAIGINAVGTILNFLKSMAIWDSNKNILSTHSENIAYSGSIKIYNGIDTYCILNDSNDVTCKHSHTFETEVNNKLKASQIYNAQSLGLDSPIADVAVGLEHLCFTSKSGQLKCLGQNKNGQSGLTMADYELDDDQEPSYVKYDSIMFIPLDKAKERPPLVLETDLKVERIWARYNETCARLSNRTIKCFGENIANKFLLPSIEKDEFIGLEGNQDTPIDWDKNTPMRLGRNKYALELAIGPLHICAILNDGTVRCWGSSGGGRLGSIARGNYYIGDTNSEMAEGLKKLEFLSDSQSESLNGGGK